eukprot:SAG11_NODE_384_length_9897_cov_11.158502_8_plen_575_part_00
MDWVLCCGGSIEAAPQASVPAVQVYTRFGGTQCDHTETQLYGGFVAGKHYSHSGGGMDYLCMHPVPQYPDGYDDADNNGNLLYGTEYENTGAIDLNQDGDASCAVCATSLGAARSNVYVQWGRQTCSNEHQTEYVGLVMSTHYSQTEARAICVDLERGMHAGSDSGDQNGALLYTTEMEAGSADESLYPPNREVSCAACSAAGGGFVYTRWGSRSCPDGSTLLYDGFIAGSHYTHTGGGYNYVCMHPEPQYPDGYDDADNNGNLLYGTEYENTGAIDLNQDGDAACAVCQASTLQVYVQWGRNTCSNEHTTEYTGLVMGTHYSQTKSSTVCVDVERATTAATDAADENGALLYTTEMEGGSSDEALYPHNREVSCAACSLPADAAGVVYTRWGSRSCPNASTLLYGGFIAGSHYSHTGGGADYLCMHPEPQYPDGYDDADNNGNLLYGTEYENTGAIDLNQDGDAACAVCQSANPTVMVQWGRQTCANSFTTEYTGLVMSSHYTQVGARTICVDVERATHGTSDAADQNGALLYTTEMEGGSSDESQYPHNREVGCAVCSTSGRVQAAGAGGGH